MVGSKWWKGAKVEATLARDDKLDVDGGGSMVGHAVDGWQKFKDWFTGRWEVGRSSLISSLYWIDIGGVLWF